MSTAPPDTDPDDGGMIVPPAVAVVDIDLLWAVDVANTLVQGSVRAEQFAAVTTANDRLRPEHGAVLVVGPTTLSDPATDPLAEPRRLVEMVLRTQGIAIALVGADPTVMPPPDSDAHARVRHLDADATVSHVVDAVRDLLAVVRPERVAPVGHEAALAGAPHPPIVVVTAAKGGEGATTVATNLAATLAAHDPEGKGVALVEADPNFGDIAISLGLGAAEIVTASGALRIPIGRVAGHVRVHSATGVQVVLPPRAVDQFAVLPDATLLAFFEHLTSQVGVIVVDAPYHVVAQTSLVRYADLVLLVTRPSRASTKNAAIAATSLGPDERLAVVVNGVGVRRLLRRSVDPGAEQIEVALRVRVIAEVPEAPELDERVEPGRVARLAEPDGDAAAVFERLAHTVRELCRHEA